MIRGKTPKKPPRNRIESKTSGDNVEVYCRIRPVDRGEALSASKLNTTTVALTPPEGMIPARNAQQPKETHHTFQHVFDVDTKQYNVFQKIALPLVDDVLHGKSALLFAYGVTCSGKTHTMTGSPQDLGLLPRCLDTIFNSIHGLQTRKYVFKPDRSNGFDIQSDADAMLERQTRDVIPKLTSNKKSNPQIAARESSNGGSGECGSGDEGGREMKTEDLEEGGEEDKIEDVDIDNGYSVFISYIEIYNNYIYDLLEEPVTHPISGAKPPTSKFIREDGDRNVYVSGIVEVEVTSTAEAAELLIKGKKRRKVAHTALNSESSRSHSVFSIRLVQAPLDSTGSQIIQDKKHVRSSQLCLVDLAGSERAGRTAAGGDRLKEASNINQSLMTLRTCIETLRENQKTGANKIVPYRDSRLTHLFKNFFDGEGKVRMIICVNPKASEYEETVQVMKFAELTQEVQISRAVEIKSDLGLVQGRRLLHQQQLILEQEQQQQIQEAANNEVEVMELVQPRLIYNLGEEFPYDDFEYRDENSYYDLYRFLHQRDSLRTTLLSDLTNRDNDFRTRLEEMEREMIELRKANVQLKSSNEQLQRKVAIYERERIELEREVGEKSWRCLQERLEKDRLRLDYNAKLAANELKYTHNIELAKKKVKEETAAQLRSKQLKLDTVRNIVCADTPGNISGGLSDPRLKRVAQTGLVSRGSPKGSIAPARSESDLLNAAMMGEQGEEGRNFKPNLQRNPGVTGPPKGILRPSRARSPPPAKTKPIPAKKTQRRSRSNDSIWIEHKTSSDKQTMLQPNVKIGRSVMKISERDVKDDRATHYVLSHQDIDSDGDVTTKFVKGDIRSTAGGGASVVFTDMEVVKRTGPLGLSLAGRKRVSSERVRDVPNEEQDQDFTDVETRCSTAIEGHPKRFRTYEV